MCVCGCGCVCVCGCGCGCVRACAHQDLAKKSPAELLAEEAAGLGGPLPEPDIEALQVEGGGRVGGMEGSEGRSECGGGPLPEPDTVARPVKPRSVFE